MLCECCPRLCRVDRSACRGFCDAPLQVEASAVCRHTGEEPPLCGTKGICNVFFTHCNLRCVYCQNRQISGLAVDDALVRMRGVEAVVDGIERVLSETENIVGFVSPSHYALAVPAIVEAMHGRGLHPTVVYNTNAYERVETLERLEDYVDIYLPDMKYSQPELAERYSQAADYPSVAAAAISEMVRQKGSGLLCDDRGLAFRGVVVRHLVLPGQVPNSTGVVRWLADNMPWNIHLSLMSQYYPCCDGLPDQLYRTLGVDEYNEVVAAVEAAGLANVWLQEMDSNHTYRPDFASGSPFQQPAT